MSSSERVRKADGGDFGGYLGGIGGDDGNAGDDAMGTAGEQAATCGRHRRRLRVCRGCGRRWSRWYRRPRRSEAGWPMRLAGPMERRPVRERRFQPFGGRDGSHRRWGLRRAPWSSGMLAGCTVKEKPAWVRSSRRRGEAEARTSISRNLNQIRR